jgi:hypothetical protein
MIRITAHLPPKKTATAESVIKVAVQIAPVHLVWDADVYHRLHRWLFGSPLDRHFKDLHSADPGMGGGGRAEGGGEGKKKKKEGKTKTALQVCMETDLL